MGSHHAPEARKQNPSSGEPPVDHSTVDDLKNIRETPLLVHLALQCATNNSVVGPNTQPLCNSPESTAVAYNRKEHSVTIVPDIEESFGRVCHLELMYKHLMSIAHRRVVKAVATFPEYLHFQVVIEKEVSTVRLISDDVPQVSSLLPVCYGRHTLTIFLLAKARRSRYTTTTPRTSPHRSALSVIDQRCLYTLPAG